LKIQKNQTKYGKLDTERKIKENNYEGNKTEWFERAKKKKDITYRMSETIYRMRKYETNSNGINISLI
jgi:hypothetical protein